ncbi:MAG: hypothetical protein H6618_10240, partial [Deltaproteobacteria bacterium]|nr:hypothetical protein [Deltaproteobacteria bacterium]
MEINLSSEEKDLKPQQQKHASSPDLSLPRTGEVDAINNNFKSLDYVPGSGGTYASMGSHQPVPLSQLSYPSSDTQNMRAHPIAGSEAQRSHTSLLRILVIIFCSVLLAVSGLVLLNDLQPGEGLDINDLMALMSGKPPDSAESSERNQALNNKDLKDSSLLPHPEEIRSEESSLQNMLAPVPIEGGIQSQSDSEMIRKSDRLPYLYLSEINRKEPPESMPVAPVWSASQEQLWRQGIAHKFPWQRYKTVMEVRAERPEQSQVILYDALNDPQFWTRMRAVIALAESGIPVPSKTVKQAIGSEEKSLVARFFKRFSLKNSAGERYILRMA